MPDQGSGGGTGGRRDSTAGEKKGGTAGSVPDQSSGGKPGMAHGGKADEQSGDSVPDQSSAGEGSNGKGSKPKSSTGGSKGKMSGSSAATADAGADPDPEWEFEADDTVPHDGKGSREAKLGSAADAEPASLPASGSALEDKGDARSHRDSGEESGSNSLGSQGTKTIANATGKTSGEAQ